MCSTYNSHLLRPVHVTLLILSFICNAESISVTVDSYSTGRINITGNEIVIDEGPVYQFLCKSDVPIKWETTGKLIDARMENKFRKFEGIYHNSMTVRVTQEATGYFVCSEVNPSNSSLSRTPVRVYVYVKGPKSFVNYASVLDLNTVERKNYNKIPCRTSDPNITPTLAKSKTGEILNRSNAVFNPREGYTLADKLVPGDSFLCRHGMQSALYIVEGRKFLARPSIEEIYLFWDTASKLECQGDVDLAVEFSDGEISAVVVKEMKVDSFAGGPEKKIEIVILNRSMKLKIKCFDNQHSHSWTVFPPKTNIFGNSTINYFSRRSTFFCHSDDPEVAMKNVFCESVNNCDLKLNNINGGSCQNTPKKGSPCYYPGCISIGDPFSTGIINCQTKGSSSRHYYFTGLDRKKYYTTQYAPPNALVQLEDFPSPYYYGLSRPLVLFCRINLFTLARNALFQAELINGTLVDMENFLEPSDEERNDVVDRITRDVDIIFKKISPSPDIQAISCKVPFQNSEGFVTATRKINVIKAEQPKIWNFETEKTIYLDDEAPQYIVANVTGQPTPVIKWMRMDNNNTSMELDSKHISANGSVLTVHKIVDEISGVYSCSAENALGLSVQVFKVSVKTKSESFRRMTIIMAVVAFAASVATILFILILYRRRQQQIVDFVNQLTDNEVKEFFEGNLGVLNNPSKLKQTTEIAVNMPYNSLFEIPEASVKYSSLDMLGKGEFGVVYKGTLNGIKTVAIKTVQKDNHKLSLISLLAEIKVMIYLGYHPNVVEFVGAITNNVSEMQAVAIVEYCSNGDLKTVLDSINENPSTSNYTNGAVWRAQEMKINDTRLLAWSVQICSGMEHLAKRKIVHGDLAARNVLVDRNMIAKVADFGLSAKVGDYSEYVKKGEHERFPWRWMALESLKRYKFSFATDVWSVGTTLWEIYSLGENPFAGFSWNNDFVILIENGLRLRRPHLCPDFVYAKILETWDAIPENRVSMVDLKDFFQNFINNSD